MRLVDCVDDIIDVDAAAVHVSVGIAGWLAARTFRERACFTVVIQPVPFFIVIECCIPGIRSRLRFARMHHGPRQEIIHANSYL